jgi:hypothetical protein
VGVSAPAEAGFQLAYSTTEGLTLTGGQPNADAPAGTVPNDTAEVTLNRTGAAAGTLNLFVRSLAGTTVRAGSNCALNVFANPLPGDRPSATCTVNGSTRVTAAFGSGADKFTVGTNIDNLFPSVVVNGGSGTDTLSGGPLNDTLNGGPGSSDALTGGDGNDTLNTKDGSVDARPNCGLDGTDTAVLDLKDPDPNFRKLSPKSDLRVAVNGGARNCEVVQRQAVGQEPLLDITSARGPGRTAVVRAVCKRSGGCKGTIRLRPLKGKPTAATTFALARGASRTFRLPAGRALLASDEVLAVGHDFKGRLLQVTRTVKR